MMPKRGGYTLIELLTVMLIIGTLAGLGTPRLRDAIYRADAVRVLSDVHTFQLAIASYYQDHGALPPSSAFGAVPDGLAAYLPAGFSFSGKDVDYAWTAPAADTTGGSAAPAGGAGNTGPGKGQGADRGKGVNAGGKAVGRGQGAGGTASGASGGAGASSAPGSGLWVRYSENSGLAEALKAYHSGIALWSPGQMLFLINP